VQAVRHIKVPVTSAHRPSLRQVIPDLAFRKEEVLSKAQHMLIEVPRLHAEYRFVGSPASLSVPV